MAGPRIERKLAAILAADVVGYSRLVGADEAGTVARLKALRKEFIEPLIAEYRGRMVKLVGDGALVEFASAVDAVECAVALQHGVAERQAAEPEDRRIAFRIGINVGDIIVEDGDILGDGVNVAARLEGLAQPGGICVSAVVRQQVRDKLDAEFSDLGEQTVKNIARPLHVYRLEIAPKSEPSQSARPSLPLPDKPSVAVLPFTNMSGDPEQDLLWRRYGGRHHHRPVANQMAVRDRPQLDPCLQGEGDRL
jgi:adenylate cyclase